MKRSVKLSPKIIVMKSINDALKASPYLVLISLGDLRATVIACEANIETALDLADFHSAMLGGLPVQYEHGVVV